MDFFLICIGSLVVLGAVAAVVSLLTKGGTDAPIVGADSDACPTTHDCSSCGSIASGECKIGRLMEEKKRREGNKKAEI